MVAVALVREQIESAQMLLNKLASKGQSPDYAAWVKETDVPEWRLYLIYSRVDQEGIKPTYFEVRKCLDELRPLWDAFRNIEEQSIRIVSPRNRIAAGVIRFAVWKDTEATLLNDAGYFSDYAFESAYFYPSIKAASAA